MSAQTKTSETVSNRPVITPTDRLGLTLCLAIITHAVVVLGITFSQEQKPPARYDAMEIILVQQRSEAPDEAKILAQASLEGGGDTAEEVSPATPIPSPFPDTVAEITTPPPADLPAVLPEADAGRELLAVETAQDEVVTSDNTLKIEPVEVDEAAETPRPDRQLPTASTLLTNSMKIASLSAEIQRKLEAQAERPKRKFISASTREFKYAAYMDAWRAKVERIGNLNYPDAARQQGLSGSLILDVALSQDGSIKEIIVRRSSGNKILDDAAIRIVNLAAPYSPFPEDFKEEVDILHITRTWQFLNNSGFR